jgi:hypothetical protein
MAGTTTKGQPTKGVVESVTPAVKDGVQQTDKNGNYKSVVKFRGNELGYTVSTKDTGASKWEIGKEVSYIPTTWTSDDGTYSMHFASLEVSDSPYKGRGYSPSPKGVKQYQAEAVMSAAAATANIILVKDNIPAEDFGKWFKAVYGAMNTELKAIFSE